MHQWPLLLLQTVGNERLTEYQQPPIHTICHTISGSGGGSSASLSSQAIIGIAVGCSVGGAIIIALAATFLVVRRRQYTKQDAEVSLCQLISFVA